MLSQNADLTIQKAAIQTEGHNINACDCFRVISRQKYTADISLNATSTAG
jgi:hypothetical protein